MLKPWFRKLWGYIHALSIWKLFFADGMPLQKNCFGIENNFQVFWRIIFWNFFEKNFVSVIFRFFITKNHRFLPFFEKLSYFFKKKWYGFKKRAQTLLFGFRSRFLTILRWLPRACAVLFFLLRKIFNRVAKKFPFFIKTEKFSLK